MNDRTNKTSICSIAFLDIVDYSKKTDSEQIEVKNQFNKLINLALKDVAQNDRIILDTGDGAAIAYNGSPEDALFTSMTIRDEILKNNIHSATPLYVRFGINLGPVRVVNDINGQPNIIGDGINVAQRIMGFAKHNQILVSRSYYEVTSRLTQEISQMFDYSGIKHDKHVREHEVYSVRLLSNELPVQMKPQSKLGMSWMQKTKPNVVYAALTVMLTMALLWQASQLQKQRMQEKAVPQVAVSKPQVPKIIAPSESTVDASSVEGSAIPRPEPVTKEMIVQENTAQRGDGKDSKLANKNASTKQKTDDTTKESTKSGQGNSKQGKSGWDTVKQSVKQGVTQPKCTQAQIAMGQCR